VLAVNRSDYMLDEPSNTLLQVELNTIASSFGPLSAVVSRMHEYTVSRCGRSDMDTAALPQNLATEGIADAIALGAREGGGDGSAVLMIVQPGERNSYDQQWIQTALWERHRVRTLRRTLEQIADDSVASLADDGSLTVSGVRIGAVYLRAGYSPDDYPTAAQWDAREKLERSCAAKCPSVAFQLAGAKKVQQDLARPGVLERFVADAEDARLLRSCFAGLWGLDDLEDPETAAVLQQAADSPDAFVLKPQREGGGNNLYGEAARQKIAARAGLAAYILMQRIRPPIHRTAMVREGSVAEVDALSELGVFGSYVAVGGRVLLNAQPGHLLRTKAATSDEGGVAAGFAVLDSPMLVD
jgi:glutathione synthase